MSDFTTADGVRYYVDGFPSAAPSKPAPKDMKEGLSSARKADLTHIRGAFLYYTARPCEYGSVKYERANFLRAVGGTKENFERFRKYLRAAVAHLVETLDAMELHQASDPYLEDEEGMRRAAYAVDTDTTPGSKVGPSLLPHVAPACASLLMAITQATTYGLLPKDPGTPWVGGVVPAPVRDAVDHRADLTEAEWRAEQYGGAAADLCPGESDVLVSRSG